MASLSLKHINKTYPNGYEAVKDFNLNIEEKEFIVICRTVWMWKIHNTSYDCRIGRDYRRRVCILTAKE